MSLYDRMSRVTEPSLARRLGTADAVVIGLGAMLGAGVFAALAPAAAAAGSLLLAGLAIAAVVATCNALSSAQLAVLYPSSGGTYVYGRRQLGPFWGHLAGFGFVVGKTASCAAMALTVGAYAAPALARPLAVAAVIALTAVNLRGVAKTARLTRLLVALVLAVLALVVAAGLLGGTASPAGLRPSAGVGAYDVLQSAGLLFFAFAGYARIATLGEEVRHPERTIPRAIPLALGVVLAVYAAVAVTALLAVGPPALAESSAPLATVVDAGSLSALTPVVRAGGAIAALGVLLSLLVGVSRTAFAMAREGELPRWLDAVHPVHRVPHHAELAVAAAVVARAGRRPARSDRLLELRRARLLRGDQRQRADTAGGPAPVSAGDRRRRTARLPAAGRDAAAGLGARGGCRAGCRGGGLRRTVARSGRLASTTCNSAWISMCTAVTRPSCQAHAQPGGLPLRYLSRSAVSGVDSECFSTVVTFAPSSLPPSAGPGTLSNMSSDAIEELRRVVDALVAVRPETLSVAELQASVAGVLPLVDRLGGWVDVAVGELAVRAGGQVPAADGSGRCRCRCRPGCGTRRCAGARPPGRRSAWPGCSGSYPRSPTRC